MSGSEDVTKLNKENEELRAQVDSLKETRSQGRQLKVRGIATVVLIVLTTLSIIATTVGVWTNRTVWNTDRYVALVAPLSDNLAVTNGLAIRLTEDTFQALDIQTRVQQALASIDGLPAGADSLLAGPLTSAAKNLVQEQVEKFLASDAFDTLWTQLNERVHTKLVALLNGDLDQLPNLAINDGQVQLNMVSALAVVLQNVAQEGVDALGLNVTVPDIPPDLASSEAIQRLSSALGVSLPADFGQITIMSEAELNDYQAAASNLKKLSGALFLLSCILLVLTIVVSPRRRRTLIWLGVAVALGFFLGGVLIRRLEARLLAEITNPSGNAAAREIFTEVLAGLRRWGLLVLIIAGLVALIAYFAGRPPWAQRAVAKGRTMTSARPEGSELEVWLAGHADLVRIGGALVGAVILFFTGIDWIPVGIVIALYGGLLWAVSVAIKRVGSAAETS